MGTDRTGRIARRVERELGFPGLIEALTRRVSGADLTSLLMGVFRSRADAVTAARVVSQYREDRFVRPSPIGLEHLRRIEDALLSVAAGPFEPVALAPSVPFGTHRALGSVPQNNVISTTRNTEIAADPTIGLALEAAARRAELFEADPRTGTPVRLVTTQRITRAQRFDGPRSFAHFGIMGLITEGRDQGSHGFEMGAVTEHVVVAARGLLAAGVERVSIALTDFSGTMSDVLEHVAGEAGRIDGVSVDVDPDRTHGRGYYDPICFKLHAVDGDGLLEYGDGGMVDWGAVLLGNAKERTMISGVSIDRLALDLG